jgi:hypothetical protein
MPKNVRVAPNSGQLLFWRLESPLTRAISVMSNPQSPDSLEPYYNLNTHTWHPIAKLSISEPKVFSITVRVDTLEDWKDVWYDLHMECRARMENTKHRKWIGEELVYCCGVDAPTKEKVSLVVKPAGKGEEGCHGARLCDRRASLARESQR